ncbi:hypothetical protein F383_35557 [Gossypium arboreum]|uniref:Uncharacterized protein n=1 Tax=Gossypium arboreum TaxID=29729 RepID=A0A0B0PR76_GOSAR|nr:hypothetical protein F383_35557 [Gossypium arboreum]
MPSHAPVVSTTHGGLRLLERISMVTVLGMTQC